MNTKSIKMASLISLATLFLAACGGSGGGSVGGIGGIGGIGGTNPPPPPPAGGTGSLSGTMTPPQGGNLQGAIVVACDAADVCNTAAKVFKGTVNTNNSYSITGLASGNYVVVALKDNGDGQLGVGDYLGCYGDLSKDQCLIVQPPKTGLNFQVFVINSAASLSAKNSIGLTRLAENTLK
jgi:uncharacterized protein (DUF2141 family)